MKAFTVGLLGMTLFAAPALAYQEGAAPDARPAAKAPALAFKGGRWFDGERFIPAVWYSVGGRFTARRPARIDATIDLTGRYVMPPLAEAHNHDAQSSYTAARSLDKYLSQGIFYSVQLCTRPDQVKDFNEFVNRPATLDINFSGACITSSDGHPLSLAAASGYEGKTPEEYRLNWEVIDTYPDVDRVWARVAERKPDIVKLIIVNSEKFAESRQKPELFGLNGMDPALVAPIVERAHRDGIRVAVHADSGFDFATAVAAGADFVAHLPGYRFAKDMDRAAYRIPDAAIEEAARRRVAVMTTANVAGYYLSRNPGDKQELQAIQSDNLRRLRAAGVSLVLGSDNFNATVIDEIMYLDALNVMPRAELLRRAVMDTSRAIFPKRRIGGFGEGMEASLVAYESNPIDDLERLRSPVLRVKQGSLLGHAR